MGNKGLKDIDFASMAAGYDEGFQGKASQRFYDLLLCEVELWPDATVLDVGCGTGALLKKLYNTCAISGFGVDTEESMLVQAAKNCPQMSFQRTRCDKLPFADQSFDVLIACMAYHHFDNREGFAREAARVLKPGGVLYIADPRFPWLVRKLLNGIARIVRVAGAFCNSQEIADRFASTGFTAVATAVDRYAQVIKLCK